MLHVVPDDFRLPDEVVDDHRQVVLLFVVVLQVDLCHEVGPDDRHGRREVHSSEVPMNVTLRLALGLSS